MDITLSGSIGVGKSTVAAYLAERRGAICFERTRLMHSMCHALVDGSGDLDAMLERLFAGDEGLIDTVRSELLMSDAVTNYVPDTRRQRRLYQEVVDLIQAHAPLAFDLELAERIRIVREKVGPRPMFVITDLYTLPAHVYFTGLGFKHVRVTAPVHEARARVMKRDGFLPEEGTFDHETERDLASMSYDALIENNGTPQQLYQRIDEAIDSL